MSVLPAAQRFVADLEQAEGVGEVLIESRARMQGKSMSMILGTKTS